MWLPFIVEQYIDTTGDYSILDIETPFLSGEKLKDGIDEKYDLKFKIGGNYYNKDGLFLESIFLDNCTVEQNEKEMICNIPRIKLENIASPDKNLSLMDLDCYYMEYICSFHSFIIMKHEKNIVKEDIYVEAIKLLMDSSQSTIISLKPPGSRPVGRSWKKKCKLFRVSLLAISPRL